LDEVQVIAYGVTSQRLNTGNVSAVNAETISKQPVNNPLLALSGRVPGLQINQVNGFAGSGVSVQIQGQNSITQGNDPFYVIDGVPYFSQLLPNLGNILGTSRSSGLSVANNGNPLSFINPQDIESISILKDADATAIYGSRAANGAILITTKKGKAGGTKVNVNLQSGVGKVPKFIKLLNTPEYVEMRNEALKNDGITSPSATDYDINGTWDKTRYTDWQKELIGGSAKYNDLQGSISGGNDNTQFLIGSGYHRETTVFPGDFNDTKGSLRFNLHNISNDKKFQVSLSASYLAENNKLPAVDLTQYAMISAPNAPSLYNSDGSINWAPDASGNSSWGFNQPAALQLYKYKVATNNLISNFLMSYQISNGLSIRSNFGYSRLEQNELAENPQAVVPPEYRSFIPRTASYGNNNLSTWIIEPQIQYRKTFGINNIDFLLGSTFQENNSNRKLINGTGYNSDLVMGNINAATSINVPDNSTIQSLYKYNALFARINYNIDDKYILNFTARRDGSSRFGAENQFHNFGAIGTAWLFSSEKFIKDHLQFLSFGKLKASYGTTGNDQIGDYTFISLYQPLNPGTPYRGTGGAIPQGLSNPYLQWEETKKMNIGLDLGFFKDRILITGNYYNNKSSNQLVSTPLAITSGFSSIAANLPATVRNYGLEFTISTKNITTKSFNWTTNINLTLPKNKLLSFPDIQNSAYSNIYIVGQPLTIQKLFKFNKVDPATGIYQYIDKNDNVTSDPSNDQLNRTVIVNSAQTLFAGLQNSIGYKNFQLDFFFQFVKQKANSNYYGNFPGSIYTANQPVSVLNRWQSAGDIAKVEKYNSDFSLYGPQSSITSSDAVWKDASYLRLKNVSLSWVLPQRICDKMRITSARIYVQGENLLTITGYDGLDPETKVNTTLPVLRVITFGTQLTF
jgi:TonB-linked SusC/RagA family outer membrane protein